MYAENLQVFERDSKPYRVPASRDRVSNRNEIDVNTEINKKFVYKCNPLLTLHRCLKNIITFLSNFRKIGVHPFLYFLTFFFKIACFTSSIRITFATKINSIIYMFIILFGIVDFWLTKNINGKFLESIVCWNEVKEDGTEVMIIESKNEIKKSTNFKLIFWASIFSNAFGWAILFFLKIINLNIFDVIIAFTMLIFAGINLNGFVRKNKNLIYFRNSEYECKTEKKEKQKTLEGESSRGMVEKKKKFGYI